MQIENDRTVSENNKIAKTFNTYFESVTDLLNLFEWIRESDNSNDIIEQIQLNNCTNKQKILLSVCS